MYVAVGWEEEIAAVMSQVKRCFACGFNDIFIPAFYNLIIPLSVVVLTHRIRHRIRTPLLLALGESIQGLASGAESRYRQAEITVVSFRAGQ